MRALNSTVSILCYACVASWAARVALEARQTRLKFAPRLSRTLLCIVSFTALLDPWFPATILAQRALWVRERPPAAAVNPLQLIWWPICLAPNGELFPGRVLGTHACMHPGADTRCAWGVLAMHTATHACMQAQTCVHACVRARTHASPW